MTPSPGYLANLFGLDGQVAVVTGAFGRLGSRYVAALVEAGASVAALDLPGRSHSQVEALVSAGRAVVTHAVDVTRRAAVDAALDAIATRVGTPTILVNNAGLGQGGNVPAAEAAKAPGHDGDVAIKTEEIGEIARGGRH